MAKILKGLDYKNIKKASLLIKRGDLVAFPTETVYGLGANAYDKKAVTKIFEVKQRPSFDPIIVHISSLKQLEEICYLNDKRIGDLIRNFWPGPLTLVLPKRRKVNYIVTAGLDTVAVRMPANLIALSLIQEVGAPIAAPSANLFGKLSPTKAAHVQKQLGKKIKIILDGGQTTFGLESTVLLVEKKLKILRLGSLSVEEIGRVVKKDLEIIKRPKKILSPGELKSHYAPTKPLIVVDDEDEIFKLKFSKGKQIAFLAFKKVRNKDKFLCVEILSTKGDLNEAAYNFFDSLHRLDESEADIIFAQKVPRKNLGRAIMERLEKASYKKL